MNLLMRGKSRGEFFAMLLICAFSILYVGKGIADKGGGGGQKNIAQFVLSSGKGELLDPSGTVPSKAKMQPTIAAITDAGNGGASALDDAGAVAELVAELYPVFSEVGGNTRYFAIKLPFSTPQNTMLNTAADIMQWRQNEDSVEAWFWYSTIPRTNVVVNLDATTATGERLVLIPTGDDWPTPTIIDGVACYRHTYALPPEFAGTMLIPPQRITNGSASRPFQVPKDGFIITDREGVTWAGFTGVDVEEDATGNILEIGYKGGVAVWAKLNGESL